MMDAAVELQVTIMDEDVGNKLAMSCEDTGKDCPMPQKDGCPNRIIPFLTMKSSGVSSGPSRICTAQFGGV